MEDNNDLEELLLRGLPRVERGHVRAMRDWTAKKLAHKRKPRQDFADHGSDEQDRC